MGPIRKRCKNRVVPQSGATRSPAPSSLPPFVVDNSAFTLLRRWRPAALASGMAPCAVGIAAAVLWASLVCGAGVLRARARVVDDNLIVVDAWVAPILPPRMVPPNYDDMSLPGGIQAPLQVLCSCSALSTLDPYLHVCTAGGHRVDGVGEAVRPRC